MKKTNDYYEILGIDKNADENTIKKAYRNKAKQYHPDKNQGDKESEEMFKKVSEAYETLSDPNKKHQYDNGGNMGGFPFNGVNHGFRNSSINDIYSSFFGQPIEFSFSNMNFKQSTRIPTDTKGVYRATLKDILTGSKVDITLKCQKTCEKCFGLGHEEDKNEICSSCNGQGFKKIISNGILFSTTCDFCNGTGKKRKKCNNCNGAGFHNENKNISLSIPAGINPMTTLKIQGKGNEVFIDKKKIVGDAYIVIDYPTKHNGVIVENGDIFTSITVPFTSILNEDEISVNILDCKEVKFKLNSSYDSGHTYKIDKSGIRDHNCAFVKVFIGFPKNNISKENRDKLIEFTKEIYGKPPNKFQPECPNNNS